MRGPAAKYATLAGVVSLVGVMGLLPMWLRNKMGARPASADGGSRDARAWQRDIYRRRWFRATRAPGDVRLR